MAAVWQAHTLAAMAIARFQLINAAIPGPGMQYTRGSDAAARPRTQTARTGTVQPQPASLVTLHEHDVGRSG